MIDIQQLDQELESLETEIKRFDERGAGRIQALRESLVKPMPGWNGLEVRTYIEPDLIVEAYRHHPASGATAWLGLARFLEGLRNVVIFLPIMITWFGIAQASNAYQALLQPCLSAISASASTGSTACPRDATQPFLYLWEQGFNGQLPPWLHLSSVGLMDAGVLLLILLLTMLVMWLNRNAEGLREQRVQALRAALIHTTGQAALVLRNRHFATTPQDTLDHLVTQVDHMVQDVLRFFRELADKIDDRFDGMADNLDKATRQILNNFAQQFQRSNQLLTHLEDLLNGSGQLAKELRAAAGGLEQAGHSLNTGLGQFGASLDRLMQQQGAIMQQIADSNQRLKESAASLQQMQQSLSNLPDAIEMFNSATNNLDGLLTRLEEMARSMRTFLDELGRERVEQAKLVSRLDDALLSLEEALSAIGKGAIAIRSIAVDMQDILRMQAGSANGATAGQGLDESLRSLNQNVLALQAVTAQLLNAVQWLGRSRP
jgi:hypothetical protein